MTFTTQDVSARGDILPAPDGGWLRVLNPAWPEGDEPHVERADDVQFVALAPAHLTPNIGPFDTKDEVYAFCEEETRERDRHYRPGIVRGPLLPWPRVRETSR